MRKQLRATELIKELQNIVKEKGDLIVYANEVYQDYPGGDMNDHEFSIKNVSEDEGFIYLNG